MTCPGCLDAPPRARGLIARIGTVVGLLAAISTPAAAVTNPIPGASIVVSVAGPVRSLDPAQAETPAERLLVANLFDRLVRLESDGVRHPAAAAGWRVSADSLTWTFALRPGMTFTDGRPVDAEAVVRAWERPVSGDAAAHRPAGLSARAEGGAVVVRLTRVPGDLPAILSDAAYGIAAVVGGPDGPSLVGSGPFRLASSKVPGEFLLVPRLNHPLGRAMPARVLVRARPASAGGEPYEGLEPVRGLVRDPAAGTIDFSLAWISALPAAPTGRR